MKSKPGPVVLIAGIVIVLLPLLMSGSTMDAVLIPRFTVLVVAVFLMALSSFFTREQELDTSFLGSKKALPFYIFLITAAVAIPGAINKPEAIFSISRDLLFFLFMIVLARGLSGPQARLFFLIKCFVLAGLAIAGFGLAQLVQVYTLSDAEPDLYLVKSTMAHRNLLVSSLVLLTPFCCFAVFAFKKLWRYLALSVLLISVVLVALLQSRTGWLAGAGMVFFFLVMVLVANSGLRRIRLPLLTLGMAFVVFTIGGFLIFYTATPEVAPNTELTEGLGFSQQDEKTFTADERIFMWKATGRMVNDRSLLGVGPGNWKIWFPRYGSDLWRARQGMVQFQRPHNDYLWILAEQGIVGLLAYLFMGLVALYCGLRTAFSKNTKREVRVLVCLILAGIMAYGIFSFFSFPRERIMHQLILYASFAIVFALYFKKRNQRAVNGKGWLVALTAVVLLPIMMVIGWQRWRGEIQTRKILDARASAQWPVILAEYQPIKDFTFYNIDPTSVPITFYTGLAHLSLEEKARAQADFEQAYRIHPYNIHVVNNLANVYLLAGNPEMAIEFYEKALEISPKYMEGVLNLVAGYFNSNQVDKAYAVLRKYYPLFSGEGREDGRYQEYLLVVLRTIRDNLKDSQVSEDVRSRLAKMSDQELLDLHPTNLSQDASIYKTLLRHANRQE